MAILFTIFFIKNTVHTEILPVWTETGIIIQVLQYKPADNSLSAYCKLQLHTQSLA